MDINRREFIKGSAALFLPVFNRESIPVKGRGFLYLNDLIKDRKDRYISMGYSMFSSGSQRGIVHSNIYSAPGWINNLLAISNENFSYFAHLSDLRSIRHLTGIEGGLALHIRPGGYNYFDDQLKEELTKRGIPLGLKRFAGLGMNSTIAFDMDNKKVYEFPANKKGRVIHEF